MATPKIDVQVISSGILPEDVLVLGESVIKQAKIPVQQKLNLQFGSARQSISVVSVARYEGIRINQSMAGKLGLHSGAKLRLQYRSGSRTLALGPLIGVLVSRDYPDQPDKPFGSITMFCRKLSETCRNQGAYVYFFTPSSIRSDLKTVEGWVYNGSNWQRATLPAPDVVNNRLTSRKLENRPIVQQFFRDIKQRDGASVFNEKFLDKSEVFEALRQDSSLQRYLPESHTLRNYTMLKSMCSRYPVVFLKPVRGSLGKGIIRLSRLGPEGWQAAFTTSMGTRKVVYPNLLKFFSAISGKMKTVRYLIQQGLTLIDSSGRPIDFRALTQKNGTGNWVITSIVGRTAGSQHYVSNLARGGTLAGVKESVAKSNLPQMFRGDAYSRLKRAALDIAKGIDTHIPAHFGELGIDLALDTGGRVWLLEVNSKPSKNDNTPLNEGKIRPSVRMMIQYARYLSGF